MSRSRLRTALRGDGGMTVIELVIASALFLVILMGVLASLDTATKAERGQQARTDALLDLRNGMTRVTKEVRQATAIDATSTTKKIDMQTLILGSKKRVIYNVSGTSLTRAVCTSFDFGTACGSTGGVLADHLTNVDPFCYDAPTCSAANPTVTTTSVRITLAGTPDVLSNKAITLATDIELRNI
jgi:hypothetical protein